MKNNEYIMHEDAENSWLQVPLQDCLSLGLLEEISSNSYVNISGTLIFLDNITDAPTFISAAEKAGWTLDIRPVYQNYSHVRAMKQYDIAMVRAHVDRSQKN
ncbi:MAG: hypothetical protein CVV44_20635 [Spirochaetae bacterium HGW-Spirochaetae-1]|jgi:hypothetical protein|nr:MAG: hypothetical protein CVV44_20635 [Spirochaetae bacterium HGW-Spirochaetae-1]